MPLTHLFSAPAEEFAGGGWRDDFATKKEPSEAGSGASEPPPNADNLPSGFAPSYVSMQGLTQSAPAAQQSWLEDPDADTSTLAPQ